MFKLLKQYIDSIFNLNPTETISIDNTTKNFIDSKINILNKKVEVKVIKHQFSVETVLEKQKAYLLPQVKNSLYDANKEVVESSPVIDPTTPTEHINVEQDILESDNQINNLDLDVVNEDSIIEVPFIDSSVNNQNAELESFSSPILSPNTENLPNNVITTNRTQDDLNANSVGQSTTNLLKLNNEELLQPELNYKVNLNNNLGSNNSSVSNDVVAKLIVSKLHNDRNIDKNEKVTITESCTYNGNEIFIGQHLKNQSIRLIDILSPNNIHLNLYSDRVKGISVDVVNKQFAYCPIKIRNQILRLLMDRDRLGNQYIGDDIVILRCVIDDDLFQSTSHLVILKEPTIYQLKDNLDVRVVLYLFVSSRDVEVFDSSLKTLIKKIKKLKERANLFGNISSIEGIWQEIATIDWEFEKKQSLKKQNDSVVTEDKNTQNDQQV